MKKVWGLFFILLFSNGLRSKENYTVTVTDNIIKAFYRNMRPDGLNIKFDDFDHTVTNEKIVRLVTKLCGLAQWREKEPHTDLELQTLSGKIYNEVKNYKDNKYHKIDESTRCRIKKNGLCSCITVIKNEYLEKLKEEKNSH